MLFTLAICFFTDASSQPEPPYKEISPDGEGRRFKESPFRMAKLDQGQNAGSSSAAVFVAVLSENYWNEYIGIGMHPSSEQIATSFACAGAELEVDSTTGRCRDNLERPEPDRVTKFKDSVVCKNGGFFAFASGARNNANQRRAEQTGIFESFGISCGHASREEAERRAIASCQASLEKKAPGMPMVQNYPSRDCTILYSAINNGTYGVDLDLRPWIAQMGRRPGWLGSGYFLDFAKFGTAQCMYWWGIQRKFYFDVSAAECYRSGRYAETVR